jgi:4-amino-4-deoxy-L-arabinose transferase-like glycosyltransferase
MWLIGSIGTALSCGLVALAAMFVSHKQGWLEADRWLALASGFAAGPALIGFVLVPIYGLGLGSTWTWFIPAFVSLTVIGAIGRRRGWRWRRDYEPSTSRRASAALVIATVLATGFAAQVLAMPLVENDALEYVAVARRIMSSGSLSGYPLMRADAASGLYFPSFHPPGFVLATAWALQSVPAPSIVPLRVLCLVSALGTAAVCGLLAERAWPQSGALAAILLLTTPLWAAMVVAYNADAVRIGAVTAALAAIVVAVERPSRATLIGAALLTAVALWSHSTALIVPAIGVLAIIANRPSRDRVFAAVGFVGLASAVGGVWYLINWIRFGLPVGDVWPAMTWSFLHYLDELHLRRGLDSAAGVALNGVLRAWTEPASFNALFWLALIAVLVASRRLLRPVAAQVALVALVGFFAATAITAIAGMDLVIKNPRYVMTLAPMAAIVGACGLSVLLHHDRSPLWRAIGAMLLTVVVAWAALSALTRGWGLMDLAFVRGREEEALAKPRFASGPLLWALEGREPGRVLGFRPSELAFYTSRPILDHMDTTLEAVHRLDPRAAADALARRGVRFVLMSSYTPVTASQSALGQVLGDAELAEPIGEHRNVRLFRLITTSRNGGCEEKPVGSTQLMTQERDLLDKAAEIVALPQLATLPRPRQIASKPATLPIRLASSPDKVQTLVLPAQLTGHFALRIETEGRAILAIDADVWSAGSTRRMRLFDGLTPLPAGPVALQEALEAGAQLTALHLAVTAGAATIVSARLCAVPPAS